MIVIGYKYAGHSLKDETIGLSIPYESTQQVRKKKPPNSVWEMDP